MSTDFQPPQALRQIELAIGGMTCASCASRIEKKLNRLDGVTGHASTTPPRRPSSPPRTRRRADELIADGGEDRLHRHRSPPRDGGAATRRPPSRPILS